MASFNIPCGLSSCSQDVWQESVFLKQVYTTYLIRDSYNYLETSGKKTNYMAERLPNKYIK